ncbi:MAG: TIR domain-containing protein [Anaerolineae bacterium]|nr:TIR domain-containing protein [Anaerolineae bacterium]
MDLPIAIILIVFTIIVLVTAFLYRRQIWDEVEDLFNGDEEESPGSGAAAPQPHAPGEIMDDLLEQKEASEPKTSRTSPPAQAPWDSERDEGALESVPPAPSRGIDREAAPAPVTSTEGMAIVPETVKFSAYYPRETAPQVWQPLVGYIFRQSATSDVMKDVKEVLGARLQDFRRAEENARQTISEGALVTATPNLPGFQVNPPSLILGFYEQFHRFGFKVRATSAPLNRAVNGSMTFSVEGVIVADLPISIFVGEMVGEAMTGAVTKTPYNSIFCSYSHDDTQIVERVEKAYKALGMTYLRDVITLRSGQAWNEELMRLIEQADIFQLFWSSAAADSRYVRQEWEYALQHGRQIRPVYWQQPIAKVPDELRSIHFAFVPDLAE